MRMSERASQYLLDDSGESEARRALFCSTERPLQEKKVENFIQAQNPSSNFVENLQI